MGCGASTDPKEETTTIVPAKPAAASPINPSAASKPPGEAMKFRDGREFFRNFLCFDRDARKATCEVAFTSPEDVTQKKALDDIICGINSVDPADTTEQGRLLKSLYVIWNNQLEELEKTQWANQGPVEPIKLPSNTIVAVLGGKYTDPTCPAFFRGTGDWIVADLLEHSGAQSVHSHSRSATLVQPQKNATSYMHHQKVDGLVEQIAKEKGPDTKVIFIYTIGLTNANGDCSVNSDCINTFTAACDAHGLLSDPNVRVVHTSSFHASSKAAGHEDNLQDNYGLSDYGASKVLQTMILAEAIYSRDSKTKDSASLQKLRTLRTELETHLQAMRTHWVANPADASARSCPEGCTEMYGKLVNAMNHVADELFEDSAGEQSAVRQLQLLSNRLDVVKLPYMLSNTAVYKRFFVFNPNIRKEMSAWDFFKVCSFKRFRIVMSPRRAALWHVGILPQLTLN